MFADQASPPGSEETVRRLRIATQHDCFFRHSIEAAGHQAVILPELADQHGNRCIEKRVADGRVYAEFFQNHPVDLLLDLETSAMTFTPSGPAGGSSFAMTQATFGIPYVVHYTDPITETMHDMNWAVHWRLLESPDWIKWVWDGAHALELRALGVSNVFPFALAAADVEYPTEPLPETPTGPALNFVGHPASGWFANVATAVPAMLRPGFIAAAAYADNQSLSFRDIYYNYYRMAEPPHPGDPPDDRARKARDYFNAKFGFNVFLAVKQRDRFVLFLKRNLGERFELIGDFWQHDLGVSHQPRLNGYDNIVNAYRSAAISLNLIKGNAETGLNLRHFEITAAGGFMLTYKTAELSNHFEIGKECVVFDDERDLLDKIEYYLAYPKQRVEIALAGQRRTLAEHLYSHRLSQFLTRLRTPGGAPLTATTRSEECTVTARA